MKFSICIPAYEMYGRGGKYLDELLKSLENQTYKDFEVLISDQAVDGSIKHVANQWSNKLDIKYLPFQAQRGRASANANNALRHASGEIMKIIDLDDFFYSPEALKKINDAFEQHPTAAWGACGFVHTDENRQTFWNYTVPVFNKKIIYAVNTMSNPSISFFKKTAIEYLDENLKWMNDCELYYRLYKKCGPPLIISETLVAVRIGSHQVTTNEVNRELMNREIIYSLKKHARILLIYRMKTLLDRLAVKMKYWIKRYCFNPIVYVIGEYKAWINKEEYLTRLTNRYRSDKGTRKSYGAEGDRMFYTPVYHRYLREYRDKPITFLEIGIGSGASLKIWPRYFSRARIYALDIDDFSHFNTKRLTCLKGDRAKRADLETAAKKIGDGIDIIIDDGGHYMDQQQISFGCLFQYLKPGGMYIIEDLCTSHWPYKGHVCVYNSRPIDTKVDKSNTTLRMVTDYLALKKIKSEYLSKEETAYLDVHIAKCELIDTVVNTYGPNHLAIFTKK